VSKPEADRKLTVPGSYFLRFSGTDPYVLVLSFLSKKNSAVSHYRVTRAGAGFALMQEDGSPAKYFKSLLVLISGHKKALKLKHVCKAGCPFIPVLDGKYIFAPGKNN